MMGKRIYRINTYFDNEENKQITDLQERYKKLFGITINKGQIVRLAINYLYNNLK